MTTRTIPSIDQLKDLAIPGPDVSYFPHTWGWAVLVALVLAGLVAAYWRRRVHWQRDLYRREALQRLAILEQQIQRPGHRVLALRELPELLKRVALSMPNAQAATTLRSAQWQAFLQQHAAEPLPGDFAAQLAGLAYQPSEQLTRLTPEQLRELLSVCRRWIEAHHVAA
jgi:hypothetical protein